MARAEGPPATTTRGAVTPAPVVVVAIVIGRVPYAPPAVSRLPAAASRRLPAERRPAPGRPAGRTPLGSTLLRTTAAPPASTRPPTPARRPTSTPRIPSAPAPGPTVRGGAAWPSGTRPGKP